MSTPTPSLYGPEGASLMFQTPGESLDAFISRLTSSMETLGHASWYRDLAIKNQSQEESLRMERKKKLDEEWEIYYLKCKLHAIEDGSWSQSKALGPKEIKPL